MPVSAASMRLNRGWRPRTSEDTRWQLARVTAVRCFVACFQNDLAQAEMYADQALRDLPEEISPFEPTSITRLAIPTAGMGAGRKRESMLPQGA